MKTMKQNPMRNMLLVGSAVFSLLLTATTANAAPKEGVSLDELQHIITNPKVIEKNGSYKLIGLVSSRCAGITAKKAVFGNVGNEERHQIQLELPAGCSVDSEKAKKDKTEDLTIYISLSSPEKSGRFCLLYKKAGHSEDKDRNQCDNLDTKKYVSTADRVASAEARKKQRKHDALVALQEELKKCSLANWDKIAAAANRLKAFGADMNDILSKVNSREVKELRKVAEIITAMKKADLDELERLMDGYSTNVHVQRAYFARLSALLKLEARKLKSKKGSVEKVEALIDKLKERLVELEGSEVLKKAEVKKLRNLVINSYSDIIAYYEAKKDYSKVVEYIAKGKEFDSERERVWDGALTELHVKASEYYVEKYKECLEKNALRLNACNRYKTAAKKEAEKAGKKLEELIKSSPKDSDEKQKLTDSFQKLNSNYVSLFGAKNSSFACTQYTMMPGVGMQSFNRCAQLDMMGMQAQQNALRTQMMNQQMQMYQQMMMMQQMGNPMMMGANPWAQYMMQPRFY